MVKETPRDDFTKDDLPGWTPEEVVELNKLPHWERLAARLKVRDEREREAALDKLQRLGQEYDAAEYPDGMTRPDGSKQGDRDD